MRFLGLLFLLLAGAIVGWDVWRAGSLESWQASALGELWYRISAGSLNMLQAATQRYLSPDLWDHVLLPLLLQPAWIVLTVPGIAFIGLGFLLNRQRKNNSTP